MRRIILLTAAFIFTSLSAGFADDRFYLELRGSLVGLLDVDHNDTAAGGSLKSDYFPGYGIGGALGTILYQRFRLEAEITYRHSTLGEFTLGDGTMKDIGGKSESLAVMANGYYDFRNRSKWTPYLGGGLGWALVKNDLDDPFNDAFFSPPLVDDEDSVFAYQLMVGLNFRLTDWIDLGIGYRFFATSDPAFSDETGRRFESEYRTHNAEVGLRFRF